MRWQPGPPRLARRSFRIAIIGSADDGGLQGGAPDHVGLLKDLPEIAVVGTGSPISQSM
jgi:hypothetical protein